jgi:hypothetical protein
MSLFVCLFVCLFIDIFFSFSFSKMKKKQKAIIFENLMDQHAVESGQNQSDQNIGNFISNVFSCFHHNDIRKLEFCRIGTGPKILDVLSKGLIR